MTSTSPAPRATPSVAELRARLPELALRDQRRLRSRLERARKGRDPARALEQVAREVDAAELRVAGRRAAVPAITYPEQLPVSQRRDDIAEAIRDHQVVVVAGETGSGKTTQLPKICLELGRGVLGTIGHTQPRRIAARTVAERIAEELDTELGGAVGYTVRFHDQAGDTTLVKLMTDGILLAEIQRDPLLQRYDTLIIDEAHERSLNIDFILGYLKELLPRRRDLKVIITSATIDPQRFAEHFATDAGPAPIIEVSGRTFPVEVRYRPLTVEVGEQSIDRDPVDAVCEAVEELGEAGDGDVLVFLSGEREIRDTADALRERNLRGTEILPLYARLTAAEQHRVFTPPAPGTRRRVVLATNVAETSLTVPGIRYVVDPGTARISRYSVRTKVQRLPIEPISQASANQRAGRCGRVADGICIRLYSEEDFQSRPEFTDPEILRTNLASVILQMSALGLGDIAAFPFVEPPDARSIRDGVALLEELGALQPGEPDPRKRLTASGRELAQLPVDPRMARMLSQAHRNGCLAEALVIVAALSIQDPRERPTEHQQAADERHARFADPTSDFLAFLNLWNHLREQRTELSSNQFRRQCKADFLHYLRIREWQDLHGQLRSITKQLGWTPNTSPAAPNAVHQALLAGLLSHVGLKEGEKREYLGARGAHFAVWPGSALARKPPRWVMVGELVETSRLWGRTAARIEPEWAEELAPHLVKRTYSEPHWSIKRQSVMAYERVTLYGIPLVAQRPVQYGRIDPEVSRELFIRHALVQGEWRTQHRFFHANRELLEDVAELESRARRRDIVVDDETLFEFYDARVGKEVVSARHFDTWWKKARREDPELLTFTPEVVTNPAAAPVLEGEYPDAWRQGEILLPLSYSFEPGGNADGVTVQVPLPLLNQVRPLGFDWLVAGMRHELVTALIKTLPKQLRRNVVPAPDYATAVLDRVKPRSAPLTDAVADALWSLSGTEIPPSAFDLDALPDHLRMTFRVVDTAGATLAEGKDLEALRRRLQPNVRTAVSQAVSGVERSGLTAWSIGELPRSVAHAVGGQTVRGYPALVDTGDAVAVQVLPSAAEQRRAMAAGLRRMLLLAVPSPSKSVVARLSNADRLALSQNPHGSVAALLADCTAAAVDALVAEAGGPVWSEAGFAALRDRVRGELSERVFAVLTAVRPVLAAAQQLRLTLAGARGEPAEDVAQQLADLVHAGFVTEVGQRRLPDLARYLTAAQRRLESLPGSANRDRDAMVVLNRVRTEHAQLLASLSPDRHDDPDVAELRWMIEELRVSLFAQTLRTAYPISEKRIYKAMDALPA
ncbi:ATP-dependent RNA helicase HrpA [Rhodococcus sp. X156]|uniref:ATP-dependent RNA helicase HrpA n=1 Tax=Rhodococcus sp. X156 TaxID=2499145 RepID=UPI000FDBEBF9|nr:ATP-dependent RNA helicase HrpA [Rhodococcus sp. X156]